MPVDSPLSVPPGRGLSWAPPAATLAGKSADSQVIVSAKQEASLCPEAAPLSQGRIAVLAHTKAAQGYVVANAKTSVECFLGEGPRCPREEGLALVIAWDSRDIPWQDLRHCAVPARDRAFGSFRRLGLD